MGSLKLVNLKVVDTKFDKEYAINYYRLTETVSLHSPGSLIEIPEDVWNLFSGLPVDIDIDIDIDDPKAMSERSSQQLASEMHELSVHLWNALNRERPNYMTSPLCEEVEEIQAVLKGIAYDPKVSAP